MGQTKEKKSFSQDQRPYAYSKMVHWKIPMKYSINELN